MIVQSGLVPMMMDGLVAVLLAATVGYCMLLDRRLKQLRADEQTMRKTVMELALATENAERAIGNLKSMVEACDDTLAQRLESAERFAVDLTTSVKAGEEVIDRVRQIVATAARRAEPALAERARSIEPEAVTMPAGTVPSARLAATAAAAEALVARARARARGGSA